MKKNQYACTASLWIYPSEQGNWHFLTVPKKISATIRAQYGKNARGWGSLPVKSLIGKTSWKTSIFPDRKSNTYMLPIKVAVRRAEHIDVGDQVTVTLQIEI